MEFATSYFGNRIVRHVKADMRRLKAEGFGIVVHTFSENDLRYYRDTMGNIVDASHEAGLRVWLDPWGLGGVFGGEAFSDAALKEPAWAQVCATGTRLPACCPSNPAFRSFVAQWIGVCLEAGADGVFWDEPHMFSDQNGLSAGCWCKHCKSIGEAVGTVEPVARREGSLLAFLHWICGQVCDAGGKSIVCLLPPDRSEGGRVMWESVASAGGVHNLGTDPFWAIRGEEPETCITRFGRELVAYTSKYGIQSHLWIQAFRIPAGREAEITTAIRAAGNAGVDVIAVWGFDACESMSFLACERPRVAWTAVLEGLRASSG